MHQSLQLLCLLMVANGAPIIARKLFGQRWNAPIDGGRCLPDGRRLLGVSKTWRGIVAALSITPLVSVAIGLSVGIGVAVAAGAMLGDLSSSFLKRRLGRPSSSQALGLDQIPEALAPLLLVAPELSLSPSHILGLTTVFLVGELLLSKLLYRLKIRQRPY